MRRPLSLALVVSLGFSLACFCAGGEGGFSLPGGSSAGPYATSLAEHLASTEGVPCPTYGPGETVSFNGFTYAFDTPMVSEPLAALPEVRNMNERRAFGDGTTKALVIPYTVTNTTPVASEDDNSRSVWVSTGEQLMLYPYNSNYYARQAGHTPQHELGSLPANAQRQTNFVAAAPQGVALEGAVVRLRQYAHRTNAAGKKEKYVVAQAVVELAPAVPGPAIVGD